MSLAGQLSAFSGTLDSAKVKLFLAWTLPTSDSAQTEAAQNAGPARSTGSWVPNHAVGWSRALPVHTSTRRAV